MHNVEPGCKAQTRASSNALKSESQLIGPFAKWPQRVKGANQGHLGEVTCDLATWPLFHVENISHICSSAGAETYYIAYTCYCYEILPSSTPRYAVIPPADDADPGGGE